MPVRSLRVTQPILHFLCLTLLIIAPLAVTQTHPAHAIGTCQTIHDIQGGALRSPCADQMVQSVPGIVTGLYYSGTTRKGFYMQDPNPDQNPATSEGILVYGTAATTQNVGDSVLVGGNITDYRPGGPNRGELTVTEISSPVTVRTVSTGNTLPPPLVIGIGGRVPPIQVLEANPCGDIETCDTRFNPTTEGIDFWRSLAGMRVQVNNALVVGPTNQYYETVIAPDGGNSIATRTPRGGAIITTSDAGINFNPQRVYIANDIAKGTGTATFPAMNVGDTIPTVVGILDYNFDNYRIELTQPISPVSGGLTQAVAATPTAYQLSIATLNVENYTNQGNGAVGGKTAHLASLIVHNLKAPDIITVEEVQDNDGATDDGVVTADQNWTALINAIRAAGGPVYRYTQIDPVNNVDGGQPGGNIRQGFLYNAARVSLNLIPGGDSTTADSVVCTNGQADLQFSPGRIDPTNPAWDASRKPLAAEFTFNGQKVIVIGNHLVAKLADQPLYGQNQPPTLASESQRTLQALDINHFVTQIVGCDKNTNVVVAGDLNDFQFSTPITTLAGSVLDNMMLTLPVNQRYSYVYDGNSEVLDQMLISHHLTSMASPQYEVVHINAEFFNDLLPGSVRASDHDPSVLRLSLPAGAGSGSP